MNARRALAVVLGTLCIALLGAIVGLTMDTPEAVHRRLPSWVPQPAEAGQLVTAGDVGPDGLSALPPGQLPATSVDGASTTSTATRPQPTAVAPSSTLATTSTAVQVTLPATTSTATTATTAAASTTTATTTGLPPATVPAPSTTTSTAPSTSTTAPQVCQTPAPTVPASVAV